jgi:DNA polymerase-3 subunit alpha
MGLFDTAEETVVDIGYTLPECDEMPQFELLQGEKEVTGMYISGHPLYEYSAAMSEKGLVKTFDLLDSETNHKLDGKFVSVVAMASKLRRKQTKSNDTMAFLEVEDMYGSLNVLVFPKLYAEYQHLMTAGAVLKITGRVSVKESGEVDLVCSKIETVKKGMSQPEKPQVKKGLYLRVSSLESEEYKRARQMLDIFKGSVPVIVKVTSLGKALVAPENRWISVEESLLRNLEEILGQDNVKYVE